MFVFANICDFGKLFKLNAKTVHAWRSTQPAAVHANKNLEEVKQGCAFDFPKSRLKCDTIYEWNSVTMTTFNLQPASLLDVNDN